MLFAYAAFLGGIWPPHFLHRTASPALLGAVTCLWRQYGHSRKNADRVE